MPGDPMRLVTAIANKGTRGFVHTLSVSRAPSDYGYSAERIAGLFQSEFTAVTDIELQRDHNERHRLVRDTA
jgi:hypothetical protein